MTTNSDVGSEEEGEMANVHGEQATGGRKGSLFKVRGKVLRHEAKSRGWLFKEHFDVIVIEFDDQDLARARKMTGGIRILDREYEDAQIPSVIRVTTPRNERKTEEFPVDASVEAAFVSHGLVEQFFVGRLPLEILGLQRSYANPGHRSEDGSS